MESTVNNVSEKSAQVLPDMCETSAQVLPDMCETSAQVLPDMGETSAQVLPENVVGSFVASTGESEILYGVDWNKASTDYKYNSQYLLSNLSELLSNPITLRFWTPGAFAKVKESADVLYQVNKALIWTAYPDTSSRSIPLTMRRRETNK